jgi:ketol-acid reductoisomerase
MEAIYDRDIDRGAIEGKTITILGYGSQGRAHARAAIRSRVPVHNATASRWRKSPTPSSAPTSP